MTINISNEGWDCICFSIGFICATIILIVGIVKTKKWPWDYSGVEE